MEFGQIAVNAVLILALGFFISEWKKDIKSSITELWERMYSHYHEIDCDNPDCKPKTGNVIIPITGVSHSRRREDK